MDCCGFEACLWIHLVCCCSSSAEINPLKLAERAQMPEEVAMYPQGCHPNGGPKHIGESCFVSFQESLDK